MSISSWYLSLVVDVCVKLKPITSILLVSFILIWVTVNRMIAVPCPWNYSISFSPCVHTYERYMTWISWVLILAVHTVCSCEFFVDKWFDSFHIFGALGTWQSFLETKTISDESMQFMTISFHSCMFVYLKCQPVHALGFNILSLNSICRLWFFEQWCSTLIMS